MLYYDTFSGESEEAQGQSGVILKGGNHWEKTSDIGEKSGNEVVISEGEVLNLDEARKAVSFDIVAPAALSEGYRLTVIRKIHDRECIQLVYSDGAKTISLFEQPVLRQERLSRSDFREYLLHLGKDRDRIAVLGWHSDKVSFNLVGEMKLPELMEIADQVQERLTVGRFDGFMLPDNLDGAGPRPHRPVIITQPFQGQPQMPPQVNALRIVLNLLFQQGQVSMVFVIEVPVISRMNDG